MIIHPSSALLTSQLLCWETMREDSGVSALGPDPKKHILDKLESPGLHVSWHQATRARYKERNYTSWGSSKKKRNTGVRKGKTEEEKVVRSFAMPH